MDKIKRYKYTIYLVLGSVSAALLIPTISSLIETLSNYKSTYLYISLIKNICILVAEISFIIIGVRRELNKTIIMTSATLYYVAQASYRVYLMIDTKNYQYIYYLIIDALCLTFTILALTDKRYLFGSIIILLVDAAFSLVNTFAGSQLDFSFLILSIMLMSSIYFYNISNNYDNDSPYYS